MAEAESDLFAGSHYRRVIAWPERIRREAPFLEAVTAQAPNRALLDVGCGTGEHSRFFAEAGWQAVGIDIAEPMIAQARDLEGAATGGGTARFERRDVAEAASLPEAPFGAAICLGNALAYVAGGPALRAFLGGVAAALAPGGIFLLQMLNYERILGLPVRAMPVNVRPLPPEEGPGDIVFVRVFTPRDDGTVAFTPITLRLRPGHEPLVEVQAAREGTHHPWKRPRLIDALEEAGFERIRALGGMAEVPYRATDSPDLVLIGRRA